jgi:hypothetical protein
LPFRRYLPTPLPRLSRRRFAARQAPMRRVFDIDDRVRLPWRFHGRDLSLFAGA